MRYRKGTFITVPNKEQLSGLDPQTQVLYMWLNSYANDDGECFPSIARLVVDCGMTKNTVLDRIAKLVELGIIKKQNQYIDNRQITNLYTMELVGEGAGDARGGCQPCTPEGAGDGHRTQSIRTQSIESISSEEEIKDNNLSKVRVSGNTTSRESIKKEEYESVPVNEYGEEISPRKSKIDRTKELAIEQLFIDECVKRQLPKPAKVPVFYLNKVRTNMLAVAEAQELNLFFDWWFQNGYPDSLLNVHSAFSTASVNRFRGRAVVQSKKSNSKYDNIKTTKYEIS